MDCRRLARGINAPEGIKEVLLHACCAPCSSAIVEWLVNHDIAPTIFYFNQPEHLSAGGIHHQERGE